MPADLDYSEEAQACFVIIKPDAIERGLIGKIITRIEETYLRIQGMQQRRKSLEWVHQHYAHIKDPEIMGRLEQFMTATSIIGFVVSGPWAIRRMRNMVGSTNSVDAAPGTIRGDFGNFPIMFNCIHASETQEDAMREWKLFYDNDLNHHEESEDALHID